MRSAAPSMSTQHASSVARRAYFEELQAARVPQDIENSDQARCFAGAVLALSDDEILGMTDSLLEALKVCVGQFYESSSPVADAIRRAACRVDFAMYGSHD